MVSVITSSNGVAQIQFDETLTDNLVIYGTRSHETGVRTLQESISSSFGTLTVDHATTTLSSGSTSSLIITPQLKDSSLLVTFCAELSTSKTASGQSFRSNIQLHYSNSSSVYTGRGEIVTVGGFLLTDDVNMGIQFSASSFLRLKNIHYNASGDWEIKPYIATADANTKVSLASFRAHYREIE